MDEAAPWVMEKESAGMAQLGVFGCSLEHQPDCEAKEDGEQLVAAEDHGACQNQNQVVSLESCWAVSLGSASGNVAAYTYGPCSNQAD